MKDNTKERIRKLIDHLGWTAGRFSREAKIDKQSAFNYYNKITDPTEATVNKILENIPFINEVWLKTGDGIMIKTEYKDKVMEPEISSEYVSKNKISEIEKCRADLIRANKTIDELLERIENLKKQDENTKERKAI